MLQHNENAENTSPARAQTRPADAVTTLTAAAPAPVADTQPAPRTTHHLPSNPQPASPLFPQTKGESARAAEAFRVYLELGPKRRYGAVAAAVSTSLRTVKRWAVGFDWRGRIKTYAAHSAEQYAEAENAVQREDLLDAAARAKTFRDRQYMLAEAMLDTAERYLERVDESDLDLLSFADACKALEVASRIQQQAASRETDDPAASSRGLRDQLEALLDQAYGETLSQTGAASQPKPATSTQAQL